MVIVLIVLGMIFALCFWPFAVIFGCLGLWAFGVCGAVVGVLVGLGIQEYA